MATYKFLIRVGDEEIRDVTAEWAAMAEGDGYTTDEDKYHYGFSMIQNMADACKEWGKTFDFWVPEEDKDSRRAVVVEDEELPESSSQSFGVCDMSDEDIAEMHKADEEFYSSQDDGMTKIEPAKQDRQEQGMSKIEVKFDGEMEYTTMSGATRTTLAGIDAKGQRWALYGSEKHGLHAHDGNPEHDAIPAVLVTEFSKPAEEHQEQTTTPTMSAEEIAEEQAYQEWAYEHNGEIEQKQEQETERRFSQWLAFPGDYDNGGF